MNDKGTEEKARRVLEAIAESVAEASDDEILEEMRAEGEDPTAVAQEVRSTLFRGVGAYKKAKLHAACEQHERQVEELRHKNFCLPDTPAAMRALLTKILTLVPEYGPALLTAQYRDFSELSDEDVRQHLVQLAHLGALEDPKLREGAD